MENRPQFPCIWLGLSKIGCITALINTNLRSQALVHSINISNAKILIYGDELADCKWLKNNTKLNTRNLNFFLFTSC